MASAYSKSLLQRRALFHTQCDLFHSTFNRLKRHWRLADADAVLNDGFNLAFRPVVLHQAADLSGGPERVVRHALCHQPESLKLLLAIERHRCGSSASLVGIAEIAGR